MHGQDEGAYTGHQIGIGVQASHFVRFQAEYLLLASWGFSSR